MPPSLMVDAAEIEPGPALDAEIAQIERWAMLSADGQTLRLVAIIRKLLRDRDALLEEITALECGGPGRQDS